MTAPTIHTERLTLRAPTLADFPAFAAFCASDRAAFEFEKSLSRAEAWAIFARDVGCWALRGYGNWAMEFEGQYIGELGIYHPADFPKAELGWAIVDPAFEGKSLAYEGALAVMNWASAQGMKRLVSYIDPRNMRSRKLAERLGGVLDMCEPLPDGDSHAETICYRYKLEAQI